MRSPTWMTPCSSSSSSMSFPNQNLLVSIISFSKNNSRGQKFSDLFCRHQYMSAKQDFLCCVCEENESRAPLLTTRVKTAHLSHWYLISGASDARHLLHSTSRLVGRALRRASTGIRLTWASGHADRLRGGRGGGRRFRLPVCPTIRLHLNLVPKPEKQRC